jgi:hypothetical protein
MITKQGITIGNQFNEGYQNINTVGTPTLKNGLVSDFTTSSYIWTPAVNLDSTNWEINHIKIKTSTLDSAYHPVLSGTDKGNQIISYGVYGSNLSTGWSSTGSSWDIAGDITVMALSSDTWYDLCMTFDGAAYKVYVDGTLKLTQSSNKKIYNASATTLYLGIHRLKSSYFNGTININELTIINNNKIVYGVATDNTCISSYQITGDNFYEI